FRFIVSCRPKQFLPHEINESGIAGKSAIVSGHLRYLEDKTQFNSFIMIPLQVGNITTMQMIPIYDQFHVYEIFESEEMLEPCGIVTCPRTHKLDTNHAVRIAGFVRELKFDDKSPQIHKHYLETTFYSRVQ
ncbi:MAG: hypothetical protein AAF483_28100, partial [Planctomycetota bacterium]